MALNTLGRHLALIGFMGSGKTTLAPKVAARLGRRVVDADRLIEGRIQLRIGEFFAKRGETEFRVAEAALLREALSSGEPAVLDLGGGVVKTPTARDALAVGAFVVLLDVAADVAWERVRGTGRPLARDEQAFRQLYDERAPLYRRVADAVVPSGDEDGVVLAAAGVHHEPGSLSRLGELVPGNGPVALVGDESVLGLYGEAARGSLGDRLVSTHALPAGEAAKSLDVIGRLWSALRLDRDGTIVALGGGTTTDAASFAAATYLRGVPWVSVPTTLVGQIDAGIGGKTAIDIPEGKNLVGAFHWPARVVIDIELLDTLPERERRQGQAELLKTELLAGRPLDVRGAGAYKAGICLQDPYDRGPRRYLNLGHTFAHALEAAAGFDLPHGEAVALGLLAALRLSGRDPAPVVDALDPQPVAVDREAAWKALQRDKKRTGGEINLVLLGEDGPYVAARPAEEVRAALDTLIR
jgi:shikimate kinase / 3-dehydroquinate synthase